MSTAATESPRRPSRFGSLLVVFLTPLASAALSVFLVLVVLHLLARIPSTAVGNGTLADPRLLRDLVEPFKQEGTVAVTQFSDVVYYPIPYATPPHLTLSSKSEDRTYIILRQDEYGFAWAATSDLKGVKDLADKLKGAKELQDIGGALAELGGKNPTSIPAGEKLTWEARGVRPFTTQAAAPPYTQHSTFTMQQGERQEGVEHFRHPYAVPPNVTFAQGNIKTAVVTPTGFRWQQTGFQFGAATVTWTAKGIMATPEQVAEFAKNPPRTQDEKLLIVEDKGKLAYAPGEQGAASFTRPFATSPNVEVNEVIVTEITPQGFKWKHHGAKNPNAGMQSANWTAKGVPAAAVK